MYKYAVWFVFKSGGCGVWFRVFICLARAKSVCEKRPRHGQRAHWASVPSACRLRSGLAVSPQAGRLRDVDNRPQLAINFLNSDRDV